jgi:uncharacterized membrane protein
VELVAGVEGELKILAVRVGVGHGGGAAGERGAGPAVAHGFQHGGRQRSARPGERSGHIGRLPRARGVLSPADRKAEHRTALLERRHLMSTVTESVDVEVPVHTAYNQWTQFEEFPNFMEGVERVTQVDDRHNHWVTSVAGAKREFDTEIVDQLPDERVAWRTVSGEVKQKGVVTFQRLDATHTRVRLAMDVEPSGMAEKTADLVGIIDRRAKGDLRRFKEYIEDRGRESGAWRGRISPS